MTDSTPAITIPDLDVGAEIGRGARTVVHRAQRGDRTVAVKIAAFDPGVGDAAARFRREAAVLASVRHHALPAVLEVGEAEGRPYLVLEYVDGVTLARRIAEEALNEAEAAQVGRTLASALAEVHRHGLVHRDVKPENIVVDRTGRAHLVDLGLAGLTAAGAGGAFSGSLLYSAPEQSGVLRRPVDGRADLYSLGCVLYECVARRPPFEESAANDLLQRHATGQAPSLAELGVDVSPAFAAIVDKLIRKDPDDRYLSATGLLADLEQIETLNQLFAAGEPLMLGQRDASPDAPEEPRLVGRDVELRKLQEAWLAALDGQPQFRLVTGEPGAGKSRLVRELIRHVRGRGGLALVARGTPDPPTPLGAIREAIDEWLRRIPAPESDEARRIVREAAGSASPIVARLSPALRALLGPPLAGERMEAGSALLDATAAFVCGLARARGGAVLVVHDCHWLDESSREVVRRLAEPAEPAPLLTVCTVRADVDGLSAASTLFESVPIKPDSQINLGPLDDRSIERIVAQRLGGRAPDPRTVAQIAARAGGNPLAARELVRAMLEAGVLLPNWGSWRVVERGLDNLALPDDVMGLLLRRTERLSSSAQSVLSAAAVVGTRFTGELLAAVCLVDVADVDAALREALAVELVELTDAGFGFVHDRVRESLLSRLDPAERRRLHQRAADALEGIGDEDPARVYARALHLARGEVERDPERARAANIQAGLAAVASFADGDAYRFLNEASAIGERAGLPPDVELTTALGDVCARLGRWSEAIPRFEAALGVVADDLGRAQVRLRLAQALMANRDTGLAWQTLERAFADLHGHCPGGGALGLVLGVLEGAVGLLVALTGVGYGGAAPTARPRLGTLARLYEVAGFVGYQLGDRRLVVETMLRSLRVGSRLGESRELAVTYIGCSLVLALLGRAGLSRRLVEAAMAMATRLGDRLTLARAAAGAAWARHVAGQPRVGAELARRTLETHGQWMDAHTYWAASADLAWNLAARGYTAEAASWLDRAMRRAEVASRQAAGLAAAAAALDAVHGRRAEARERLAEARRLADATPVERWRLVDTLGWGVLVHLEVGDLGAAFEEMVEVHRAIAAPAAAASFHARHFHLFHAHARLAQCMGDVAPDAKRLAALSAAVAELGRCGRHPTFRAHQFVLAAALNRLRGHGAAAGRLLERAARLGDEVDAPWVLYEVERQRAHLCSARGDRPASVRHAYAALSLAHRSGWTNRAAWVRAEFGLDPSGTPPGGATQFGDARAQRPVRHLEALQAVAGATASVRDPDQLARVALDEVVAVMGAERAFLFLTDADGGLRFKAGRGPAGEDLPELHGYSRTVLEAAAVRRQPVLLSGTDDGELASAASVVAHGIRSILAAPLILRDRLVGVLYLDNRLARGVFGQDDLAVLAAVASLLAVAFETAAAFADQAALGRANAALLETVKAQVAELRRSRGRITAAEERLRREIGEMLHSRVQSRLLVAWHRLGQGIKLMKEHPDEATTLLAEVCDELDEIREREIRQASHLLHPAVLRVGLLPALRSLINTFGEQFDVELRADAAVRELDDPADNRIDETIRLAAYRVVEEALANVAKHAGAAHVTVTVDLEARETLVIAVRDDGRGFDPTRRGDGLGLTSIATRVEAAGGEWDIGSAPGAGTTVSLRLPVARNVG